MVVEFNETGSSWGPYQAIFQYGYAEAGIFYSVSGAASLNDPGHRTTALNLTLPDEYYPFWDLDYVGFYNRTGVVSPSETINYPTSSNRTGLDTVVINSTTWRVNRVVSDSITGITNHTRVVNLQTANITQVRLHFASVNLDQDDSLHIFNDTSVDRLGSPPEWSKHDSGSDVWTSWINMVNTTSLHLVLYSNNTSASYTIDYIEYTGSTYSKTLATDKSYIQIVTNPDYIGFNVTLAKLTLPNNSVLAFVDPIGRNMTELWNVGPNQNYTVVNNNSDAGGLWGPSEWIMPEYVNIALYYTDNSSHTPAYLEIGSIEFNRTKGWERYLYPENNVRQFITYSKGTQNVVVNFTRFLNSPDVLFACSSWSFIFTKRPFNTVMTLLDENGTVVPGPDQNLLYNKEYTARFNITDTVNGAPIDAYNIVGHTNTVNLDIWQTNESILQRTGVLSGGLVNFTFTLNGTMLPGVRAGDIKMLVQVHDVNYGAYDNSTSRQAYGMHLFEIPRFTLNCIASEEIGATIATNITTTSGTIYDPNTVTFNLTAYNAYNESGPLNGQPIKVRVFKDTTLRRETYIYQTYHLASNSNFALFTHDFLEEGAWLVTFALLNESLPVPKPEGFYLPTAPLAFSFTIQPRQFTIDITTGSAGLQPAQASEVLVLVTDKEESEDFPSQPPFPLQGWEVNYYFMMLVGSQYQNYFIGSSTTNATGVAKLNWIPPAILAGETIFIKAHAFTKVSERVRFVDESVLVKKGFTLDRLNTSIALRPASDQFYFDDEFTISVDVVDEIGNIVMDRLVAMNLTFVSVLGPAYTYSYTLLTGVNNTRYSFPSAAFLGTVRVDLHFAGSSNYHPSSSNRTFTFDKVNSYIETSIDSFGYHYGEYQKIPINVLVRDGRTGGLFYDNGTLSVEIRDATGGLVEAHDKQIEFLVEALALVNVRYPNLALSVSTFIFPLASESSAGVPPANCTLNPPKTGSVKDSPAAKWSVSLLAIAI